MQLFSILMCYRDDRNITPQYSPSLLRPFFFVLPSCNTQAAFKKLGTAEQGIKNSQATQQNYHLGIHQPHTKLTYISLYAQQYNRQLTNHTMEIRVETHLSHYRARDHILQTQASFLLQSWNLTATFIRTETQVEANIQSVYMHLHRDGMEAEFPSAHNKWFLSCDWNFGQCVPPTTFHRMDLSLSLRGITRE
jgi:hypothetical protein